MLTQVQIKQIEAAVNNTALLGKEVEIVKIALQNVLDNQSLIIQNQNIILKKLERVCK